MDLISKLLIAPPSVKGCFWYKTVIMVIEHNDQGSIGLTLNKRSDMTINQICDRLDIDADIPGFIYNGGPVSQNSLSMLHSSEWSCQNTLKINEHFSVSSSKDMLPKLAAGDFPEYWRLFFGMAGWYKGQLLAEINGNKPYNQRTSWCLCESNHELVFDCDSKTQWNTSLEHSADEFAKNINF